jgi:hypothetical protein
MAAVGGTSPGSTGLLTRESALPALSLSPDTPSIGGRMKRSADCLRGAGGATLLLAPPWFCWRPWALAGLNQT